MAILSPFKQSLRGVNAFMRGLRWLRGHPVCLLVLFLPIFLGLCLLILGGSYFFQYQDQVFSWLMYARPESWWALSIYYVLKFILYVVLLLLGFVFYALFVNVVSSPIYDYVSLLVERDLLKGPVPEISIWEGVKLIGEELKKACFIVLLSGSLLLIPGLNVLAPILLSFCIGWDLYDFPLARRGWSFRKRFSFVSKRCFSLAGLGIWLLIPGLQVILMPLAVVGGTILAVEDLQAAEQKQSNLSNPLK